MSYCRWFSTDETSVKYHEEWGTPLHDDRMQFEYLSMEVMQCGLSFGIVLARRAILRSCFDNFNYDLAAAYTDADVNRIMHVKDMIHSEKKIRAIIQNAGAFQNVRRRYGSFSAYLWSFTDNKTVVYRGHETGRIPASNALSAHIAKDLKEKGFTCLGPVVIYSHLQACGIINDHDADCPRRKYLIEHYPTIIKGRYGEKGLKQF